MFNHNNQEWTENTNEYWSEHFETTYYLKYNLEKALYSLNKILITKIDYTDFSNRCTYYHFYIDNLTNALGHISKRFNYNSRITIDNTRVDRNKYEYNYETNGICNFPNVNNKQIRNFIEHIDEKDEDLIKSGKYYGTFNVIYKGMNPEMKKDLLNNEKKQNNILNLINKTYNVYYIKEITSTGIIKTRESSIKLLELKNELEILKKINDKIWYYLNTKFFK